MISNLGTQFTNGTLLAGGSIDIGVKFEAGLLEPRLGRQPVFRRESVRRNFGNPKVISLYDIIRWGDGIRRRVGACKIPR